MPTLAFHDVMGFAAAATTLAAFAQRATVPMRIVAAISNLCFIVYGAVGALYPPLILHSILLPLNVMQLVREMRSREPSPSAAPRSSDDRH